MPEAGLNSTCVEGRQRPGLALLGFRAGDCYAEIPSCRSVEELAWRAEVVRRADPNHILTSHSAIPSIFTLPGGSGQPDDWKMARTVDAYGTSFYPKHSANFEARDPSFRSAHLGAARSACDAAGKPCWIGELQGGHGYVSTRAMAIRPKDVELWGWGALSHGAKALCYYAWYPMTSGVESGGFGLTEPNGVPTERAWAAGAVSKIVDANQNVFVNGRVPKSDVGILYSVPSNILWTCMGDFSRPVSSRSLLGANRAMFEKKITIDFLHVDQIVDGALADYRVLYMPFIIMISRPFAERVAEFVRSGGIVVAEARCGWNDETGMVPEAIPGMGLDRVFGCKERSIERMDTPEMTIVSASDTLPSFQPGDKIKGAFYQEELEVISDTAQVIAEFPGGAPAIVMNRYGKGKAIFIGTMLSYGYEMARDVDRGRLLSDIAISAGVQPLVCVEGEPEGCIIEPRILEGIDAEGRAFKLLFGFNHGQDLANVIFKIKADGAEYLASDLKNQCPVPVETRDGRIILRQLLEPESVCVIKLVNRKGMA
ncbi:MAG: hypothetical protein HPY52_06820 [Firmicutes bacterium]|nr:hypothetical protein [Bacillota bacterium]